MSARARGGLLAAAAARRLATDAAAARASSSSARPATSSSSSSPTSTVGFIGCGAMGNRMAARLLFAGHAVVACDASPAAREALVERADRLSGRLAFAASPAALARTPGLAAVVTSLPTVAAVEAVYCRMLDPDGGPVTVPLLIDASTAGPATARALAAAAARVRLAPGLAGLVPGGSSPPSPVTLDAPVSGGVAAAEAGTLTFLVGGPAPALAAARPILGAMGSRIIHVGHSPGAGAAAKVANNLALAVQMAGLCEALALGSAASGVDPAALLDVINASSGRCWASEEYPPVPGTMGGGNGGSGGPSQAGRPVPATDGTYRGGFAVRLMRKDLELAAAEARALLEGGGEKEAAATKRTLASLPMATAAAGVYARLAEVAGDDVDFSGVFKFVYGGW
jgi:3-hydroxyisobutyrate dehydrogenase-like beta-hydroxyacid dehydrogenase